MWIQGGESSNNKEQAKSFYLEGRKTQAFRPKIWDMSYFQALQKDSGWHIKEYLKV